MFQHHSKQKHSTEMLSHKSNTNSTELLLLNVIVCSEDKASITLLSSILQRISGIQLSFIFYSSAELIESFKKHATDIDVLFVDKQLMNENLVTNISSLTPSLQIVTFGQDELLLSNDILPYLFGYIKAPFLLENVLSVITSIRLFNKDFQQESMIARKNFILVKSEYKLIKTNLSDIFFIAGMKDYTQIYLKGKVTPLTTLQNLKEFEKKLPSEDFIRVHRSYIIAVQYIDCISRNEILIGNHSIPVGDAFRNSLNTFIEAYT